MTHSVVIPYYNQPESLASCLASLQHQTALPDQIIIVDDGSTVPLPEGHAEVIRLPRHPSHYPQYATAVNRGVAAATGDILTVTCCHWDLSSDFCAIAQGVPPQTVWLAPNVGQAGVVTDPQQADNHINQTLQRRLWTPWEEGFDAVGGTHALLEWIWRQMQAGVVFQYTPSLVGTHTYGVFPPGSRIRVNQKTSWYALELFKRGKPTMARAVLSVPQPSLEEERIV